MPKPAAHGTIEALLAGGRACDAQARLCGDHQRMQPALLLLPRHRQGGPVFIPGGVPPAGPAAAAPRRLPLFPRHGRAPAPPGAGDAAGDRGGAGLPGVPDHQRHPAAPAGGPAALRPGAAQAQRLPPQRGGERPGEAGRCV